MNLFRIRGILLAVHASFLPLLAYAAYEGWASAEGFDWGTRWLAVGWCVALVGLLFTCVTLHELGHSFMARRFGVRVPRILLLPIGGMAEFDSIPRQPRQEILIALAGPAVNFAIVAILMIFVRFPSGWDPENVSLTVPELFRHLVVVNLAMGLFNLVPVFPMDGGRVFRALLARKLTYVKATRIAAGVGKVLAVAGVLAMVFYFKNYLGGALFAFIFVAGEIEWRAVDREDREARYWEDAKIHTHWAPPALPPAPPIR